MLRLLALRARAQWGLLCALLAVVTIGATVLGVCALLVTRSADRALEMAASRASAAEVEVTAYTATISGPDARSVAADARGVLTASLAPFEVTTVGRAVSQMRVLPQVAGSGTALAYLAGMEDLARHAELTAGRWPRADGGPAWEAVVLESTARQLGLTPGSRVRLGTELAQNPVPSADVLVVGVVRPLPGASWTRDPLHGDGFDLAYGETGSATPAAAYGPFLVDFTALLAGQAAIGSLEITARPDLSDPARRDLDAVADAVQRVDARMVRALGDRVKIQRTASGLPATLHTAHRHQQVTDAVVLALAALGTVLTVVTFGLAGRLTADLRTADNALLSAMGVSRGQFTLTAAAEAATLGLLAAGLAVPASALLHAALVRLPQLAGAGLSTPPTIATAQVIAVTVAAVVLVALLVVPAIRPAAGLERTRREALARSGMDLLLAALAFGGWWQVRAQSADPDSQVDAIRVLVPALALAAGAALALRLLRPALAVADRLARRADGLVLPLAVFEAARRPQATAAGLLVTLACATAVFGTSVEATWQRSQHDQAAMAVGTDLALSLDSPAVAGQGAAVSTATGGTVSPAADRGVAIGQWLGSAGNVPWLVAVDTTRAGDVLRGRLDRGRTWAAVTAPLAPAAPAAGIMRAVDADFVLTGQASDAATVTAAPTMVLQDATGLRTTCTAGPVPLDGHPHPLAGCDPAVGLRVVAVSLKLTAEPVAPDDSRESRVTVTLAVDGTAAEPWTATAMASYPDQIADPAAASSATGAAARLQMTATIQVGAMPDPDMRLVAAAFADSGPVPVAVSAGLAEALGTGPGSQLDLKLAASSVPITVAAVVPDIPSAPGGPALLADLDALSRALILRGDLAFPADAWWVGHPDRPDAAARATDLNLGPVTTRTAETARRTTAPVAARLPAMMWLLVPATVLLLLAGVAAHVTSETQSRAAHAARLRGLGMTRRQIRAALLGRQAIVLVPLCSLGAAVGALATPVIAPLLIRSDTGATAVPAVVPVWPWATGALLFGGLLTGCLAAAALAVTLQVRRSGAAQPRTLS